MTTTRMNKTIRQNIKQHSFFFLFDLCDLRSAGPRIPEGRAEALLFKPSPAASTFRKSRLSKPREGFLSNPTGPETISILMMS